MIGGILNAEQLPEWMKPGAVCRVDNTIYAAGQRCRIQIRAIIGDKIHFGYYDRMKAMWLHQVADAARIAAYIADGRLTLIQKGRKQHGED